ncbi:MAG: diaminopimelate epimerase [Limisphaerales bacterium]
MIVEFTKMNGAGNDFVLVDNRTGAISLSPLQVVQLCDRHRGIGADGIILLARSRTGQAEWAWDFYNSDGSTAEMCGNGARCFARFLQRRTGATGKLTFETLAGLITATIRDERVSIEMTRPKALRLKETIPTTAGPQTVSSLDTGVPHAVIFVPDADRTAVRQLGAEIRHHPHFSPRGTNVNFVQILGPNAIRVRTYERGVEDETLACGTGVTAAALIAARVHGFDSPVAVRVQGGDQLEVAFHLDGDTFSTVQLAGPADFVFSGRTELPTGLDDVTGASLSPSL